MALQAWYDPKADRMRLMLHLADNPPLLFWVTRRQWLSLLRRLRSVAQQIGAVLSTPEQVRLPRNRCSPKEPKIETLDPVMIDGIRLRADGNRVRLMLLADEKETALNLNISAFRQLEELVALQAERAGWDPRAAMQRLDANEIVRAAMTRAGRRLSEL